MSRLRHHAQSPLVHEPEHLVSRPPHSAMAEAQTHTAPAEEGQGQVTVISGAHLQHFPLAGMPVVHARVLMEQLMGLHPDSPTLVNGNPVENGYALQAGDTLEFVHHAGEKGRGSWITA
jgi:hypothetical protein